MGRSARDPPACPHPGVEGCAAMGVAYCAGLYVFRVSGQLSRAIALWLLIYAWTLARADEYRHNNNPEGLSFRPFQGLDNILEVECTGEKLENGIDVLSISLFSQHEDLVLTSVNLKKKECTTSHSFSLCIKDEFGHKPTVKTLVLDLRPHESRVYGCNLTVDAGGRSSIMSWTENVTRNHVAVTTIAVLSSSTVASSPVSKSATPAAPGSTDSMQGVDIPPGLLVTGLVFLIVFMILSLVLIVMHFKERRRRHYLSEEYDTPLPIKGIESPAPAPSTSRGVGEKERILGAAARSPRPSTSSSPHPGLRKASGTGSGGGGSVRYQQTGMLLPHIHGGHERVHYYMPGGHERVHYYMPGEHESVHYMPGMSVYYAEPWSGVDSESRERLRPSSRGTSHSSHDSKGAVAGHMSHDSKGGPVTSSAPPADDNA